MRQQYNEPKKCDEISQMTITALYKRGRAGTSQLRQMVGAKSRSIRHRIDEYLAPAGLVTEVDRRDHPGNDERVFELTNEGKQYVSDEWSELAHYARRREVIDATRETRDRLDILDDRIDDFGDRVNNIEGDHKSHKEQIDRRVTNLETSLGGELGQLRSRVDELEEQVKTAEQERDRLADRVEELEEEVSDNAERLALVEEVAEEAWAWVRAYELQYDVDEYLNARRRAQALISRISPFDGDRDWQR